MKKKLHLSLAVACVLLSIGFTQAQDQKLADKQFSLGEYRQALSEYLMIKSPEDDVIARIARCYMGINDPISAITWFEKITSENLRKTFALEIGDAYKRLGRYDDARVAFGMYESINPTIAADYIASCNVAFSLLDGSETPVYNADFNTRDCEYGLTFYNDQMVFCSFSNRLSFVQPVVKMYGPRLYAADSDETLSDVRVFNLRPAIKSSYFYGPVVYRGDKALITYANNTNSQPLGDKMLHTSLLIADVLPGGDFANEQPLPINSATSSIKGATWVDDQTIIFASDMEGGLGGFDLYTTTLTDGVWSSPKSMGFHINTPGDELTPWYSEGTLYFASNYHAGLGGFDIFKAHREEDLSYTIVNMGNGINSGADEYFPSYQSGIDRLYFTSNRLGGRGMDDIYVSEKLTSTVIAPPAYVIETTEEVIETDEALPIALVKSVDVVEFSKETPDAMTSELSNVNDAESEMEARTTIDFTALESPVLESPMTSDRILETPVAKEIHNDMSLKGARRVGAGDIDILKEAASVYFVQLAAFKNKNQQIKQFEKLVKFGNIYKVYYPANTKVRLGYYLDEEEARHVLRQVKAEGYRDAFVTLQPLDIGNIELVYSNYDYEKDPTPTTSTQSSGSNTTANTTATTYEPSSFMVTPKYTGQSQFKVRLASYENPRHFDLDKAKTLGRVEQWTKSGWTIFILSGFNNQQEAEQARQKALQAGYADAEVVLDNDGILERLNRN